MTGVNLSDTETTPNSIHRANKVCYAIGSYNSMAWLGSNPNAGIYVTNVARTLDNINCGYPACNQGGVVIVEYDL